MSLCVVEIYPNLIKNQASSVDSPPMGVDSTTDWTTYGVDSTTDWTTNGVDLTMEIGLLACCLLYH